MSTRFISIDPSTTFTGWAVFQDEGLVAWGKIDTRKLPFAERFQAIVREISRRASQYGVQAVAIEDVKFAWKGPGRQRNIAGLQAVFRSLKDWSKGMNLPFKAYNPASWKNFVVGHVHASKGWTKDNITARFPRVPKDLTEHEYDAIAIGVYHGGILHFESMAEGR